MDVTDLKERETSINEANEDYEDEENSLLVPQAFPLTNYRPKKRFLKDFPPLIEAFFEPFDTKLIKYIQKFRSLPVVIFDLIITALFAIELGIVSPFILFILGYDGFATELSYFMMLLTLISQIPKRFIWRYRPYMVSKAKKLRRNETAITSSFPSRAVTCALLYPILVFFGIMQKYQIGFQWWMPIVVFVSVIATSFARINLGVHYPSDCLFGFLQGVLVLILGSLIWELDIIGCNSCFDHNCYTPSGFCISQQNFSHTFHYIAFLVSFVICIFIVFISIVHPIDFWDKCDRIYGMLLSGIIFKVTFLCPKNFYPSLPTPELPPPWHSYLFSLSVAAAIGFLSHKNNGRIPVLSFILIFLVVYFSLVTWRTFVVQQTYSSQS